MKIKKIQKALRKGSKKLDGRKLIPEFVRPNADEMLSDANITRRFLELFSPGY